MISIKECYGYMTAIGIVMMMMMKIMMMKTKNT